MKHKKIHKKFILYLDGDLHETERRKIEKHMLGCAECRNTLKAVSELWKNEEKIQILPPESLWHELKKKIEENRVEKASGLSVNKNLIINTAAAIAIVVISVFTGSRLGVELNPSLEKESGIYFQNGSVRDDFGINYFDVLPPNSIAEDVFIFASNTEVDKK